MSLDFYLQYEIDGNTIGVFDVNITHNLGTMAQEAGIYYALWQPEEIGVSHAKEIVTLLEAGLRDLLARPDHFRKFDSPNGWGIYDHFLPFVEEVLEGCRKYPNAKISVSR